ASAASARSTTSVQKPTELDGTSLLLNESSNDLEVALELPVGDGVEPLAPFPLAGGGEVIDEVVAEPVPGDFGGMEDSRRLDEGARHAHDILAADIIAADGPVRERELARDALEPRGDARGDREIGVTVGAGAARLDARRLGRSGQHAERHRAVVDAPRGSRRRPEAVDEALVRVDVRPEHRPEFEQERLLSGDVAFEELRHAAVTAPAVVEQVALAVGEALVHVARAARIFRAPLRHEARHDAE